MNVRSRTARAAVLGVAALALASCSDVNPGSAAVVDGKSISMKEADRATGAYCELSLAVANQQGIQAVSKAETRRQSVTDLITLEVARNLAEERDVEVDPSKFVITNEQQTQIEQAFPDRDLTQITAAIARSQETYAIIIALGEKATGTTATDDNTEELEAAGQKEVQAAFKDAEVEIDPRFGLDDAAKKVSASGSLSVPETAEEVDATKLPASQLCS